MKLVDATYPDGASLSGVARKVLVLLLAKAAGDAWQDAEFCITKGELRGRHQRLPKSGSGAISGGSSRVTAVRC